MDVSDILNNLNEAQRNAVTSESSHLLVLAGAGSGKTRVIAHKAILDSEDQYRFIKRVCKSMGVDEGMWPARQIQWYINKEKDECRRANQAESADDYFVEQMTKVYEEYEQLCERESLVDFGELLLRSLILLSTNESLLSHYQKRFKHILVHEFQDTNEVQYRLLS